MVGRRYIGWVKPRPRPPRAAARPPASRPRGGARAPRRRRAGPPARARSPARGPSPTVRAAPAAPRWKRSNTASSSPAAEARALVDHLDPRRRRRRSTIRCPGGAVGERVLDEHVEHAVEVGARASAPARRRPPRARRASRPAPPRVPRNRIAASCAASTGSTSSAGASSSPAWERTSSSSTIAASRSTSRSAASSCSRASGSVVGRQRLLEAQPHARSAACAAGARRRPRTRAGRRPAAARRAVISLNVAARRAAPCCPRPARARRGRRPRRLARSSRAAAAAARPGRAISTPGAQAEQQHEQADQRQPDGRAAHGAVHRVDALGDPHRPVGPAAAQRPAPRWRGCAAPSVVLRRAPPGRVRPRSAARDLRAASSSRRRARAAALVGEHAPARGPRR